MARCGKFLASRFCVVFVLLATSIHSFLLLICQLLRRIDLRLTNLAPHRRTRFIARCYNSCISNMFTECQHARTILIAKDEHGEYLECLDCGEIFDPAERRQQAPPSTSPGESLADA